MSGLRIGAPYRPSRRSFPEGGQYGYRGGEHELALFLASPSVREVDVVGRGEVELGLMVRGSVIFFLYRFGAAGEIDWSDAPFSIHKVPEAERALPPRRGPREGERSLLTVVLVDAATGLVRALRTVSLSPAFSAALHDALAAQASATFEPAVYTQDLNGAYDRFAHSRQMAARSLRTAGTPARP